MILIILILLFCTEFRTLDIYEQEFICLYDGIQGFPVNCSDAVNGCNYPGLYCDANLSLITFNIPLCGGNNIIPTEINNLVSLTGFQVLLQDNCLTPPKGIIPKFTKTNLLYLGLANLDITGTIPTELFLNTNLKSFNFQNAKLSGTIPSLNSLTSLTLINILNNNFNGNFPNISNLLNLQHLKIGGNNFTGLLPDVKNCNQLKIYDVSVNNFVGDVGIFNSSELFSIDMSGNKLDGTIANNVLLNTYYQVAISMKFNKLVGTIPSSLFTDKLIVLDLSSNFLSGTIPKEIINTNPHVQQIILSRNLLSGSLPTELNGIQFSDLFKFDVSHNNLQGSIPSFEMMSQTSPSLSSPLFTMYKGIIYLELYSNNFNGMIPYFNSFKAPTSIDFSSNMIDLASNSFGSGGNITWLNLANNNITNVHNLNTFYNLISLNLGYNNIVGTIPSMFSVQYLRLNNNYFTGAVDDLLINPNFTMKPIFVDLTLNRLDIDVGRNTIFGTQSTENTVNTEIIVNNFPQDIDECVLNVSLCEQLCIDGYYPVGSYTCGCQSGYVLDPNDKISCKQCALNEWSYINYVENDILFPKFRSLGYNNTFAFSSCSKCSNGISVAIRSILSDLSCSSESSSEISDCSFACSNLTIFISAGESLYALKTEFETNDFLNDIINKLYGINITIVVNNKRTEAGLNFELSDCSNVNITDVSNIIIALSSDIIPNIPSSKMIIGDNCSMELTSSDTFKTGNIILISVLGFFGILIMIIIIVILILFINYKSSPVHYLPSEVKFSFLDQLKHPWRWTQVRQENLEYYYRDYKFGSEEYDKVQVLLTKMKKGCIRPTNIRAIYNPSLTNSFINQWKIMTSRKIHSEELFYSRTYTKDQDKMKVMKHYNENVLNLLDCNNNLDVPLLPSLHGTSVEIADKIALNNIAKISSLDQGFYGSGSYFTTNMMYTLPYCCGKRQPCILISYINPGNIFPVTEHHLGKNSLLGASLKTGYNSHYVLTKQNGEIYDGVGICSDEIVVNQEAQILPAFIISIDTDSSLEEFEKWNRVLPNDVINNENRDVIVNIETI